MYCFSLSGLYSMTQKRCEAAIVRAVAHLWSGLKNRPRSGTLD